MIFKSFIVTIFTFLTFYAEAALKVSLTKDNVILMNQAFDVASVSKVAQRAKEIDALLPSNEPIFLIINSPGGSIDAGIELINNLNGLHRPVHTITLFAASMGFQTVQGVKGKRLITNNGTLMSHRARGAFSGEFPGQLDSRYNYYLRRVSNLDDNVIMRTNNKYTKKSYAELIRDEFWCDGKDCVTAGFADAVVTPVCDGSLQGTQTEVERFAFMGFPVELTLITSKCPTITGIIDFKVSLAGEDLFKKKKENEYDYDSSIKKLTKEEMNALMSKVNSIIDSQTNKLSNIIKY